MDDEAVLATSGLTKRFGALVVADGIDFDLRAGERRALIGPNGAGKTTFVALLSGLLRPDAGRITLLGRDMTRLSADRRVKAGVVRTFQISSLFRSLSVLENVYLAASEALGAARSWLRPAALHRDVVECAEETLAMLGLDADRHRKVVEIAYGRQRLVEIAIALCLRPKVLVLDEPAAGIPADQAARLLDVIERLPAEMAILMIEHDMQVVRRFASRVSVFVGGTILMTGAPQQVMSDDKVRSIYLGRSGHERFLSQPPGA